MSQNDTLLFIRSLGCTVHQFAAFGLSVDWVRYRQENGQPGQLVPLIFHRKDNEPERIITTPQAKALIKRGTLPPPPAPAAPRPEPQQQPPAPEPPPPASPPEPPPHYRPAEEDYAF